MCRRQLGGVYPRGPRKGCVVLGGGSPPPKPEFKNGAMKRRVAAFNSPGSAGLYAPWRGGNLNDGANCGLPCANGNNSPANSNWNGVPRHADDI